VTRQRDGVADRLIVGTANDGDRLVENGQTHEKPMQKWGAAAGSASWKSDM
jgi:hypothetical protein